MKIVGQNFWYLISEDKDLYTDIIEPIGYHAKEHNENFIVNRNGIVTRLTVEFAERFCDSKGIIDWIKLVEYACGNFDLDQFLA